MAIETASLRDPPAPLRGAKGAFRLDSEFVFLNHGSFGAVPRAVEAEASRWRDRLEARPIEMVGRAIHGLLGEVRESVGCALGCAPERVGLVTNATTGIGAVLNSIEWRRGDRILVTNHGYNAVRQAVQRVGERWGTQCVVADLPLPLMDASQVVEAVLRRVDAQTRLVIVDHITSPTALVFPVKEIAAECRARGVLCLVDGAHAPGMLPLAIDDIGADWYTGNLHKWMCAPKGSGILVASEECARFTHPETISHFHGSGFVEEFGWQGTRDYANWLAIPAAINFMAGFGPGAAMAHNRALANWAHGLLARAFRVKTISPLDGTLLGSMATIPLPESLHAKFTTAAAFQARLYDTHKIEIPVIDFGGTWHARVSAQVHNAPSDYLALEAAVLAEVG